MLPFPSPLLFGTPSAPVTDPNFSSTKLLLSGNGVDGSTTFTDESAAARGAATSTGAGATTVQVATSASVFGGSAIRFDGAHNDFIGWADHADWLLRTDTTIEGWFNFDDTTTQTLVSHYNTTSSQRGWVWYLASSTNLELDGSTTGGSVNFVFNSTGSGFTFSPGTWYYLCLERSGNTMRMYAGTAGGTTTMIAKTTSAVSFFDSTAQLRISGRGDGSQCMAGYLDEFRWSAIARYNTDAGYAVPTAAFPRS
jgi:hypothetical protein